MRALLLAALLVPGVASAQRAVPSPHTQGSPGDCAIGEADTYLDVAGVRSRLFNTGGLFWRHSAPVYEVPKHSGITAVFVAGLWVGGQVDGELRFAGSAYGPWEYWPGPLDANGETTATTCGAYDRIWTVTGADLDTYEATGVATADLAEWPVGVGAPYFVDTDGDGRQSEAEPTVSLDLGDPGYGTKTLDLDAGERPVIFGRQTAWWVMNDTGGPHEWGGTAPLGIEVRVTAWVRGGEDEPELYESTFYRYEILNRSPKDIEEGYVSMHIDPDLGNYNDNYMGSNEARALLYVYNGDNIDDGAGGYGTPPPALGIDVFSGGHSAMSFGGGTVMSDPGNASEAYSYQQALWKDGTPLKEGRDGYNTNGPVTRWRYSGVPPAFWSEVDKDGQGNANIPGNRSGVVSARLPRLAPGERATVDLGFLFARGADHIDSVHELLALSDAAQGLYDAGTLMARVDDPPPPSAPTLAAPADGATFTDGPVRFTWESAPGATANVLQVSPTAAFDSLLVERYTEGVTATVERGAFPFNRAAPLFWRVVPSTLGVAGPPSTVRAFVFFRKAFSSFEVVANAAGPIAPHPGAAAFQGFPTPGGESPVVGVQQTNGTRWLVAAGGTVAYDEFLTVVLRDGNADRAFPHDFELRFTGPSTAYRRFQDSAELEIPFELWDTGVGTPDDPSDDVRMVIAVYDNPGAGTDGNGVFDLSTLDSPVSSWDDDPESDWVYGYYPTDTSPGEAGYLDWLATADTDPAAHGPEVLARLTFVGWDLGTTPPYVADGPEPGTVFRLVSSDLQGVSAAAPPEAAPLAVAVSPNPVRAVAEVTYLLAEPGAVRLRVVDVLGREVAVLADGSLAAGRHSAALEASALAAGVYLVVLDVGDRRVVRTMTVTR